MKYTGKPIAQGDVLIVPIDAIPEEAVTNTSTEDQIVIAHSETGHHHWIPRRGVQYFHSSDPMMDYVKVASPITVKHDRPNKPHAPVDLPKGSYVIKRQRMHTPEGWQRVID